MSIASLLLTLVAAPGLASEAEAESCLRTKVWDSYAKGWGVRTLTTETLSPNTTRSYVVTFYRGNEYQVRTCGDDNIENLDVYLYDLDGSLVLRDDTTDREPVLSYTPENTSTFYVVVHARTVKDGATSAGIATAITYR